MAVATYTKTGTKATTAASLDKEVFGLTVKNHQLLKDAYLAHLANGRSNLAVTKKRGQVSGGGKKPWRQKGTGRARFGSSRNPIWRGGGVAFGPTGDENYTRKLHVKARRQALKQALSLANSEARIKVIEDLALDGKSKSAVNLLAKLDAKGNVLIVTAETNENINRSISNLPNTLLISAARLTAYHVINADQTIIAKPALDALSKRLNGAKDE